MILKKRFWGAFLCLELADGKKTHGRLLCEGQGWVLLENSQGKALYRLRDLKACRVEAEEAEVPCPNGPTTLWRPSSGKPERPRWPCWSGETGSGAMWIICWGPWSA